MLSTQDSMVVLKIINLILHIHFYFVNKTFLTSKMKLNLPHHPSRGFFPV